MEIYDIHSHFGPTSSGENADVLKMINDLKKYNISKIGISCLSKNNMEYQNKYVYDAYKKYPNIIFPYVFVNPKEENAIQIIEKYIGNFNFKAVKFHSWKQGYYPDNRPELTEIFNTISKYNVHIQTHVGTAPLSNPYTWLEWAKKYKNINFVFTHIGYYEFGLSTIYAIKDYNNIFVETSGQMDIDVLKYAIKILGTKRIVFGTDYPYKPVNVEIEKFHNLNLNDNQLEDIFSKNAKYLLNI